MVVCLEEGDLGKILVLEQVGLGSGSEITAGEEAEFVLVGEDAGDAVRIACSGFFGRDVVARIEDVYGEVFRQIVAIICPIDEIDAIVGGMVGHAFLDILFADLADIAGVSSAIVDHHGDVVDVLQGVLQAFDMVSVGMAEHEKVETAIGHVGVQEGIDISAIIGISRIDQDFHVSALDEDGIGIDVLHFEEVDLDVFVSGIAFEDRVIRGKARADACLLDREGDVDEDAVGDIGIVDCSDSDDCCSLIHALDGSGGGDSGDGGIGAGPLEIDIQSLREKGGRQRCGLPFENVDFSDADPAGKDVDGGGGLLRRIARPGRRSSRRRSGSAGEESGRKEAEKAPLCDSVFHDLLLLGVETQIVDVVTIASVAGGGIDGDAASFLGQRDTDGVEFLLGEDDGVVDLLPGIFARGADREIGEGQGRASGVGAIDGGLEVEEDDAVDVFLKTDVAFLAATHAVSTVEEVVVEASDEDVVEHPRFLLGGTKLDSAGGIAALFGGIAVRSSRAVFTIEGVDKLEIIGDGGAEDVDDELLGVGNVFAGDGGRDGDHRIFGLVSDGTGAAVENGFVAGGIGDGDAFIAIQRLGQVDGGDILFDGEGQSESGLGRGDPIFRFGVGQNKVGGLHEHELRRSLAPSVKRHDAADRGFRTDDSGLDLFVDGRKFGIRHHGRIDTDIELVFAEGQGDVVGLVFIDIGFLDLGFGDRDIASIVSAHGFGIGNVLVADVYLVGRDGFVDFLAELDFLELVLASIESLVSADFVDFAGFHGEGGAVLGIDIESAFVILDVVINFVVFRSRTDEGDDTLDLQGCVVFGFHELIMSRIIELRPIGGRRRSRGGFDGEGDGSLDGRGFLGGGSDGDFAFGDAANDTGGGDGRLGFIGGRPGDGILGVLGSDSDGQCQIAPPLRLLCWKP